MRAEEVLDAADAQMLGGLLDRRHDLLCLIAVACAEQSGCDSGLVFSA